MWNVSTRRLLIFAAAVTSGLGLVACESDVSGTDATDSQLESMEGLGSLSFPHSGNDAAHGPFLRGVLLLHSFEYETSAEAFREAQEADPQFALAYWGEAMTYKHPLWRQKDEEAAEAVLSRLAPTAKERRAKAGAEREGMYLDAVEALYAEGTKADQDRAYMEAMRRLHDAYPDDQEARAFYALSILGSTNGSRDFATYMKASAMAQPVHDRNPSHPGAVHYMIHSFDDPVHAPLGLPAARAYSQIAPHAAHAQHMTTHIFLALGMWDDVVSGNIRALDTEDRERAERGRPPNSCGHYASWLHYGHLMRGDLSTAETLLTSCHERMADEPTDEERRYFVSMRARQILDTADWSLASRWTIQRPADDRLALLYEFTNALAALREGDAKPARVFLESAPQPDSPLTALHLDELRGLAALHEGRTDAGLSILREVAETEDSLPFEFGQPRVLKPTFELLGEELLALGHVAEARDAFQRAVERNPARTLSVQGLQRASSAS